MKLSKTYETSAEIILGIFQGDNKAEVALIRRFEHQLYYILEKRTQNSEVAKDIVQEAFLIVLLKLRREPLNDPSKLSAYLHGTAVNIHKGEIRKQSRRRTTTDTDLLNSIACVDAGQDKFIEQEETSRAISNLLAEMTNERDRIVLTRYYIDEEEKKALCEELDINTRHFDRVISRARKRLKELIEAKAAALVDETLM